MENYLYQFFLRIKQLNTAFFKENKHELRSYPFISINKRMILHKTKAQSGSFLIHRWKQLNLVIRHKGTCQRRFQQAFIPYTIRAAGFLNHLLMPVQ